MNSLKKYIKEYYYYAKKELGLENPIKIFLKLDRENSLKPLGKTAYYDPQEKSITLFVLGRHTKDVLRSLSHEMCHAMQDQRGDFDNIEIKSEKYAQENLSLRELEREAYEKGNLLFRDWEDFKKGEKRC